MNPNLLRNLLIAQATHNPIFNSPSQFDYNMDNFNQFGGKTGPGVGGLHYTDWYKKPTHETFSREAIDAAVMPELAGQWLRGFARDQRTGDINTFGYVPSFLGMQYGKRPQLEQF